MEKGNPPYVTFEVRAVEDRDASIEHGKAMSKDVEYALITPMGSKDRVERVVSEWFEMLEREVADGRFPRPWLDAFKTAHTAWKNDQEVPEKGTSIKQWTYLSPAQVKNLLVWHIRTVEDIANANEETIRRLGMGGYSIVQAAKDYLAMGTDPKNKTVGELAALRASVETLKASNEALQAKFAEAQAALKAAQTS